MPSLVYLLFITSLRDDERVRKTHTHTHTHTIKKRRGNIDDDDDGDGLTHGQCNHHHRDHSKKRKKNEDRSSWHKIDEYEKKIYKCSRWDARTKRTERRG